VTWDPRAQHLIRPLSRASSDAPRHFAACYATGQAAVAKRILAQELPQPAGRATVALTNREFRDEESERLPREGWRLSFSILDRVAE
jgi:hypothetical protein